ncbi:serine/threonine-protein kinase ULK4-like [Gorilla gorilla gorilla]|uniref:serine/threonine-protein kinase ULK4-like n=1 Tax=Gorilla gorilla gorilla TaxID=9595 RepID=UPI00300A0F74
MTAARDRLLFRAPPAGGEGKMSMSGFKARLKLLASIFQENQEPQPRLTLHRNIKITSGHLSQQDLESQMRELIYTTQILLSPPLLTIQRCRKHSDKWANVARVIGLLASHKTDLQENTPVVEVMSFMTEM